MCTLEEALPGQRFPAYAVPRGPAGTRVPGTGQCPSELDVTVSLGVQSLQDTLSLLVPALLFSSSHKQSPDHLAIYRTAPFMPYGLHPARNPHPPAIRELLPYMSSSSLEIARAFGGLCAALGLGTRVENPVTKERQLPKAALASLALPGGLDGAGLVEAPGLTGRVSSEKSRQEVDSSAREMGAPTQVPSPGSREADLGSEQAWSERGVAQERVRGQKTVCHHQTQVQCSRETHHPAPPDQC